MANPKSVAYVVMPPGHGKSYMHTRIPRLVEADSIFDCRGDETLEKLRKEARATGNWSRYDSEWANRIAVRLTEHRWILMVPANSVGQIVGEKCLGQFQLTNDAWDANVACRGKSNLDYEYARLRSPQVQYFQSNNDLSETVIAVSIQWLKADNLGL